MNAHPPVRLPARQLCSGKNEPRDSSRQNFFFLQGAHVPKKKVDIFFFFKVKSTSAPPTFSVTCMWASVFPRTHLVLSNLPLRESRFPLTANRLLRLNVFWSLSEAMQPHRAPFTFIPEVTARFLWGRGEKKKKQNISAVRPCDSIFLYWKLSRTELEETEIRAWGRRSVSW